MKKVLVIDDTPEVRMIISETLNLFGFSTLAAEDGETGLSMACQEHPDLVICDINMPKVDGYTTLTSLRSNAVTATIPFIFLSGATDKINMRRGMELGADDYLTKPFTPKELLAAVNTRLSKQAEMQRHSDSKLNELRGNISLALPHELRTPLNGILGLAGLLIDDYASMDREEVLESARFIQQSALRLHRLIENFLVYSQIELMASEKKRIDLGNSTAPVQVERAIPETARDVATRHKRPNDLTLQIGSASLLVPEENLKKLVEEFVDNAFKFSTRGQPVIVATECVGNTFHLSITDSGRGMTPEQIGRIGPHIQFERKTFEQQGAGLGLVIAKRMVELLGGACRLDSKVGEGTTVKVSFPVPGL